MREVRSMGRWSGVLLLVVALVWGALGPVTQEVYSDGGGMPLLVKLAPGADAAQVAADHGATLLGVVEPLSLASFDGGDVAALQADPRVLSVQEDAVIEGEYRYIDASNDELMAKQVSNVGELKEVYRYIDASYWYIDASYWYIDASYWYIDASYWYIDASHRYVDARSRYIDASYWYIDASYWYIDASYWYIDASGEPDLESVYHYYQWSLPVLRALEAHERVSGQGVTVAVLDSGVDLDHPELAGKLVQGYDCVDEDTVPDDAPNGIDDDGDSLVDEGSGHGTHVAGIVALAAPDAKIMPVRIFNSDGRGTYFDAAQGIVYAVDHGAQVINLSGSGEEDIEALRDAVEYAWNHGVIVVAAGGVNKLGYPARYDHVISVGASDWNDYLTDFSTFTDGEPTVYAPGRSILSTYNDGGFAVWTGNSMAAPFVAGEVALLRSVPGCGVDCVMQTIADEETTRPVPQTPYRRVDLYDAVAAAEGMKDVSLLVKYANGDTGAAEKEVMPLVKIGNWGNTLPYSALTLRYWFTPEDGATPAFYCDYAPFGCENVQGRFGVEGDQHYLEVSFTDGAGLTYGGREDSDENMLHLRIQTIDQPADESNDYSHKDSADVEIWDRVTLYFNGELVWGMEPTTASSSSGACQVEYVVQNDWGTGATVNVRVHNLGSDPIEGWTLNWMFPGDQTVTSLWNGNWSQNGASVQVSNVDWNATIAPGGTVEFGFNLAYSASNAVPTEFYLNGVLCQ